MFQIDSGPGIVSPGALCNQNNSFAHFTPLSNLRVLHKDERVDSIYLLIASKHRLLLSVVLSVASVVIPYLAGIDLEIKHSQMLPETTRS